MIVSCVIWKTPLSRIATLQKGGDIPFLHAIVAHSWDVDRQRLKIWLKGGVKFVQHVATIVKESLCEQQSQVTNASLYLFPGTFYSQFKRTG